jgi:hypothetical protein
MEFRKQKHIDYFLEEIQTKWKLTIFEKEELENLLTKIKN